MQVYHVSSMASWLAIAVYITWWVVIATPPAVATDDASSDALGVRPTGNSGEDWNGTKIICAPARGGFLFLDDKCLLPPYVFESSNGLFRVNDIPVEFSLADLHARRKKNRGNAPRHPLDQLTRDLQQGNSIILSPSQPAIRLEEGTEAYYLLKALIDISSGKEPSHADLDWLSFAKNRNEWIEWLRNFQATDDFLARARAEIVMVDEIEAANQAANRLGRRQGNAAYLLLTFGLALSVVSFGHLIAHHPSLEIASDAESVSSQAQRFAARSLYLAASLAGLDLIWTVLWIRAGNFVELNPIGSQLIRDPHMLLGFKVLATVLTVSILFTLKRHRFARIAAWWSCLVLTLVVVRWLTVNSLFAS